MKIHLKNTLLILADNSMILGQRLGEWCGHGPILEQDIALTNISLDLIGEARLFYQILAKEEGKSEDDYPMLRDARSFRNVLLVEQPNGHWGDTIMRQFLFDCFHYHFLDLLQNSTYADIAGIASKCVKEARYHLTFSSDWVQRLGDGTLESHEKIQASFDHLFPYMSELMLPSTDEEICIYEGVLPEYSIVKDRAFHTLTEVLDKATLHPIPKQINIRSGGKSGLHSEHLGFILTELQYLVRSYPGASW